MIALSTCNIFIAKYFLNNAYSKDNLKNYQPSQKTLNKHLEKNT